MELIEMFKPISKEERHKRFKERVKGEIMTPKQMINKDELTEYVNRLFILGVNPVDAHDILIAKVKEGQFTKEMLVNVLKEGKNDPDTSDGEVESDSREETE